MMSDAKCLFAVDVEVRPDRQCQRHDHACVEIGWILGAAGALFEGDREHRYGDRDIFIHHPGVAHWAENRKKGIHFCVGVISPETDRLPSGVRQIDDQTEAILTLMRSEASRQSDTRQKMLNHLASALVIMLARSLGGVEDDTPSRSIGFHAGKAKKIIDAKFQEPLNIKGIASSLYISPDYLRQMFKKAYGESPIRYLIRKRIDHASELLRISRAPVHEIAAETGFDSPYYFCRLFKKVTGVTPSEYRRGKG